MSLNTAAVCPGTSGPRAQTFCFICPAVKITQFICGTLMKECKSKRSSGCQRGGRGGERSRRQVAEGGDRGGERRREEERALTAGNFYRNQVRISRRGHCCSVNPCSFRKITFRLSTLETHHHRLIWARSNNRELNSALSCTWNH